MDADFYIRPFFGAMLYMNYLQKGMMTMNTIGGGEKGGWERVRERERGKM